MDLVVEKQEKLNFVLVIKTLVFLQILYRD